MPIHDFGYRHWTGKWTSKPYRWLVITRQGVSLLIRKKRFLILMILSSLPLLVGSVLIYLSSLSGQGIRLLQISGRFFEEFLTHQMFFAFIIAIYAGSGLIANDLRANALQIYLSKPITRWDYILGKLGVMIFFLALTTLTPGVLLFLLAAVFESNLMFLSEHWWILGSIIGYSLVIVLTFALVILALSALSRSASFAGIAFAAAFFFSQILYGVLSAVFRSKSMAWISLSNNLIQTGDLLFGSPPRYSSPAWISVSIIALLISTSLWVVQKRVRGAEVVS
jgi:ABC-2 type transport system permease protein